MAALEGPLLGLGKGRLNAGSGAKGSGGIDSGRPVPAGNTAAALEVGWWEKNLLSTNGGDDDDGNDTA